LVGNECLRRDEYDRPLAEPAAGFPTMDLAGSDEATAAKLRQALTSLPLEDFRDTATGKPAWGIEFRAVRQGRGVLVPLVNLNKETKTVQLPRWANQPALDLLSGETMDLNAIRAEPMLPRLLQIQDASL